MPRWNEPHYPSGYDDWYYPPSRPLEAKGGIKAQSKQGAFGQHWWAKRWIAVLEGFNLGARLTRGRTYARQGQVLSIEIAQGTVKARVQGSRPRPYDIRIQFRPLNTQKWERVVQVIASEALFAAKLFNGEMPQEIERAFKEAQVSLFPQAYQDLETSCSCPDWSNPCKHIAAVYYLLGEAFDRDPFLLFKLRGLERDEFLALLGTQHPREAVEEPPSTEEPGLGERMESLTSDPERFWAGQPLSEDLLGEVSLPPVAGALVRRLGPFPFWRGEMSVEVCLSSLYAAAGDVGLGVVAGEVPPAIRTLVRQHPLRQAKTSRMTSPSRGAKAARSVASGGATLGAPSVSARKTKRTER
jgi:uncharacterized Zn finger protein